MLVVIFSIVVFFSIITTANVFCEIFGRKKLNYEETYINLIESKLYVVILVSKMLLFEYTVIRSLSVAELSEVVRTTGAARVA